MPVVGPRREFIEKHPECDDAMYMNPSIRNSVSAHILFSVPIVLFALSTSVFARNPFYGITPCQNTSGFYKHFIKVPTSSTNLTGTQLETDCLETPDKTARVCMSGPNEVYYTGGETYQMSYQSPSRKLTWKVVEWDPFGSWAFTIESKDLDGSGRKDLIVNVNTAVSNGLAVSTNDLYVITSDQELVGPFEVEDYGLLSGLYRVPGREGCVLLDSQWTSGTDPVRGPGTYVDGTWYIFRDNKFVEFKKLLSVKRRYLYRFGNEIGKAGDAPMLWFEDKTATTY